jgi:DNA repair exonuclease SbcCD ATPase subunit
LANLARGLEGPLAGVRTALSSSIFGLAGALALGVLDLQAGHAQNRFYASLEEFLAGRAQLPANGLAAEGEGTLPGYLQALLEQTAENLSQIERMMTRSEEDRRAGHAVLAQLADRLTELSDQLRAEQKVILALSKNQLDLQPAMAELANQVADAVASNQEMRAHLRNVDVALARLVDEVSGAREEMPEAMRQEIKILAQTLGAGPRARM